MKDLLEPEHEIVGVVQDGAQVVGAVTRLDVQLLILDLALPNVGGTALIRAVREAAPAVRILVVTGFGGGALARYCVAEGADGFVSKSLSLGELPKAARAVLEGKTYVVADDTPIVLPEGWPPGGPPVGALTPRQQAVLAFIGQGLTDAQIGEKLGISERTVELHRSLVRRKLGVKTTAELYRIAFEWAKVWRPS